MYDTAGSAKIIAEKGLKGEREKAGDRLPCHMHSIYLETKSGLVSALCVSDCAAIASELAGSTYGLEVLDTNIEDDDSNFTRFLLLSRQSIRCGS